MTISVTVGHNVRYWTTLQVEAPTPEEREILLGDDEGAILTLLRKLDQDDRLGIQGEDHETGVSCFNEDVDPAVIDTLEEED